MTAWRARIVTSLPPRLFERIKGYAKRSTPGQATIEFALVLPIMLLIALGAVDVGRVFFDYIGLRTAAMEGAIYGSRHSDAADQVEQRVRSHLGEAPDSTNPVSVAVSANACLEPGSITVAVSRDFRPITTIAAQLISAGEGVFRVATTATARCMTS